MTRIVDVPAPPAAAFPAAPLFAPQVSVMYAVRRYWLLIAVVAGLFTAAGIFAASARPPVYTAETRMAVGRVDTTPGTLSTFTAAAQSLAAQYSRTINADGVVTRAAATLDMTPGAVAGRVSATPIPESPVIRVRGKGSSAKQAVRVANAAGAALIGYTTALNRSNPDVQRLLSQYKQASARVLDLRRQLRETDQALVTPETQRQIDAIRVDLSVAQLRLDTIRATYSQTASTQGSTSLLQVLAPARGATSDRSRSVQTLGFIGLAVGLAVGLALAMHLATRHVRRRTLRG